MFSPLTERPLLPEMLTFLVLHAQQLIKCSFIKTSAFFAQLDSSLDENMRDETRSCTAAASFTEDADEQKALRGATTYPHRFDLMLHKKTEDDINSTLRN